MHELVIEQEFVRKMHTFIQEMCLSYDSPTQGSPNQVNDLLTARGEWLSHCGRYLLNCMFTCFGGRRHLWPVKAKLLLGTPTCVYIYIYIYIYIFIHKVVVVDN